MGDAGDVSGEGEGNRRSHWHGSVAHALRLFGHALRDGAGEYEVLLQSGPSRTEEMGQGPIRRAEGAFQRCRIALLQTAGFDPGPLPRRSARECRWQDHSIPGEYCGAFVEERGDAFTMVRGVAHGPLNDAVPGELLCKIRLECMPAAFTDFGQRPRRTGCKIRRQPDGRVLDLLFCDDPVYEA